MKEKPTTEFDKFDHVIDGLLAVPYKELQQRLDEEKKLKAEKKMSRSKPSTASRASSSYKK